MLIPQINKKYLNYIIITLIIISSLLIISCDSHPQPVHTTTQQAVEQPVVIYKNNTVDTMATAAVVGATTAYATNKYMNRQKQINTTNKSTPISLDKPTTYKSVTTKPSYTYTNTKRSNVYKSSSSRRK